MHKIFLIRHAQPQVTPDIPAHLWSLAPEGHEAALHLAQRLAAECHETIPLYASPEPKAHETAHIIAQCLNLSIQTISDLREHEREQTPFLDRDAWEATITAFFTRPDELIFGNESAQQALQRFSAAIEKIVANNPHRDLIIVTHGTVISLFVASHNPQIEVMTFWRSLTLPDLVALTLPNLKVANGF